MKTCQFCRIEQPDEAFASIGGRLTLVCVECRAKTHVCPGCHKPRSASLFRYQCGTLATRCNECRRLKAKAAHETSLRVTQTTQRKCLRCDEMFASSGDRTCGRCQRVNASLEWTAHG